AMAGPLWTFEEIAAAVEIASPADGQASGVAIDSRTLKPGDAFVAIRGERNDGHDFAERAFANGAAAAIVALDYNGSPPERTLFRVPDTLAALNALGRAARKRASARIAAVTGSVGKTGTKEMLRLIFSAAGPAHASEKSYNNLWGVPLSLARMPKEARFGVFEIGMNHAGEITPLAKMVRPQAAIITWIAPVHIEFFNSQAEIADAKAEIFDGLEGDSVAILPADNGYFGRLAEKARNKNATVISFGEKRDADARLTDFAAEEDGSRVTAEILGTSVKFLLPAPGRHLAVNALAALAAAKLFDVGLNVAAEALGQFQPPEGRGRRSIFQIADRAVILIDESYNANPASMNAALSVLGTVSRVKHSRRIAVLGDMLELGHASAQFHADLARAIDLNRVDLVFCAGPLMAHLYELLPKQKRGGWGENSEHLCPLVLDAVTWGDAVMIKGSLGSRMGLIADALRARFDKETCGPLAAQKMRC
ncbi:MAG TPA: UDP-N-acetylmuramoylalanyl-D-glutamyl-2,6-diaminopimelate--D-alanyl-D-alanine ligase, partial [Hyphomicrobiales bacterium]|nr:UDP-N-acetylmuramoylalanyl-D-glutamyl-2,6-diaminopimelate--D-alanyl-D-alanine ligase [Hyphomicrobiales bacterium]